MNKQTYWLIGILALVVIIFIIIQSSQPKLEETASSTFAEFDTLGITKIKLDAPGNEKDITLERTGKNWQLTAPIQFSAADRSIEFTFKSLAEIPKNPDVISENPEKQHKFEVDSLGTNVKIYKGDELVADFIAGKTDQMRAHTYLRERNSNKVVSVPGNLSYIINQPLDQWRDKSIVNIPGEEFDAIEIVKGDTYISLARQDTLWQVLKNGEAITPPEQNKIDRIVQSFSPLRARGFAKDTEYLDWQNPQVTIKLLPSGTETKIINFIKENDNSYYTKVSDKEATYKTPSSLLDRFIE